MKKIIFVSIFLVLPLMNLQAALNKSEGPPAEGKIEKFITKIKSAKKDAKRSAMPGKTIEITGDEIALYMKARINPRTT